MAEDIKWVEVYRTGDDLQMEFIRGLLTTSGIHVVVDRKGGKDMPIILGVAAYGEYVLKVHPDQEHLAVEILEAPVEESGEEDGQ